MNLIAEYSGSDEENAIEDDYTKSCVDTNKDDDILKSSVKVKKPKHTVRKDLVVRLNPDVDIDSLEEIKTNYEKQKFESRFSLPDQKHKTGYIAKNTIDEYSFHEQYYSYNSFGMSTRPTDYSNVNDLIQTSSNIDTYKSVFATSSKSQKDYSRKLKHRREKYGDPSLGNFKGPWACYQGEEDFKVAKDLTQEQKDILQEMEIKRIKKIDEESKKDKLNVSLLNLRSSLRLYSI